MLFYILSRLILRRFLGLLGRRTSDQVSAALSELCRILLTDRILDSAKDPSSSYTGDHFSISDTISIIFKNFDSNGLAGPLSQSSPSLSLPSSISALHVQPRYSLRLVAAKAGALGFRSIPPMTGR